MKDLFFQPVDTPVGRLGIVCNGKSIIRLLFAGHNPAELPGEMYARLSAQAAGDGAGEVAKRCAAELQEYFEGKRHEFSVPVSLDGTPFEQTVWAGLRTIPYGHTVSYSQLAGMCGVRGARAVGSAVGRNPVPILVPCHRVIRRDGSMGGYYGGVDVKVKLLALEKEFSIQ